MTYTWQYPEGEPCCVCGSAVVPGYLLCHWCLDERDRSRRDEG
jgi:hypothetical protein